jgi:cbb3-type cytochrome oxidase cytochrome c subunit
MEQKDKAVPCPENESMMQSGTKECADGEMYETSSKEKMESIMEEKSCNETMTGSMMKEKLANKGCYNESSSQANLDYAHLWLKKAMKIHEMHLMNPSKATEESNMKMMDQMMEAKKYLAGEKIDMDMMDRVADNESAEYEQPYAVSALMRLDCSGFWLDEAIKLHEMHMKNPETATNESQMRLMAQMVRANRYLAGEDMDMEMAKKSSLSQDNIDFTTLWLEKAIKLHAMGLKAPEAATNESQMRLMNQMMRARECIEGKDLNLEMLMDFEEDSAREMCEPSSSEMCEPSPREKMMFSMIMNSMRMGEKSYNETVMDSLKSSMTEDKAAEKDKMDCMMEEKEANESCYTDKTDQKVSLTQANLDSVCLCLEKAMKLHEMYLRNPEAATSESKMEMMKEMMQAREYLTGEKMDISMTDKAIDDESASRLKEKVDCLSSEKSEDCSSSKMGQCSSTKENKKCLSSEC